jgi:formylglycine-generating enzyme required for sulfatase activity
MKAKFFLGIIIGLFLIGMQACVKETLISTDEVPYGSDEGQGTDIIPDDWRVVHFSSKQVANKITTRTTTDGSGWIRGDRIGIFMLSNGATEFNSSTLLATNSQYMAESNTTYQRDDNGDIKYDTDGYPIQNDVSFTWANPLQAVTYPSGVDVPEVLKFVAYYPFRRSPAGVDAPATLTDLSYDFLYNVDVTNQDNPESIDLLYSTVGDHINIASQGGTRVPVDFKFAHKMARIVINTRSEAETNSVYHGTTATIDGLIPTGTFDLKTGAFMALSDTKRPFYMRGIDAVLSDPLNGQKYDTAFQAVIIPQDWGSNVVVNFFGGSYHNFNLPLPKPDNVPSFEAGKQYTYWITFAGQKVASVQASISNLEVEEFSDKYDPTTNEGLVTASPAGTKSLYVIKATGDTVGVVYIPPTPNGAPFIMGNYVNPSALPSPHEVYITRGFLMQQTPVTDSMYCRFLNELVKKVDITFTNYSLTANVHDLVPSAPNSKVVICHYYTNDDNSYCSNITASSKYNLFWVRNRAWHNHPVMNVSWYGAMAYAAWAGGNLPTEAQWEYAARNGIDESYNYIYGTNTFNEDLMKQYAHFGVGSPEAKVADKTCIDVRSKKPNAWNLYDMFGNVWEWTRDTYHKSYITDYPGQQIRRSDPLVWQVAPDDANACHPIRGGSFAITSSGGTPTAAEALSIPYCLTHATLKSDYRGGTKSGDGDMRFIGFRVAFHADNVTLVTSTAAYEEEPDDSMPELPEGGSGDEGGGEGGGD